jgi:hypothetical protein
MTKNNQYVDGGHYCSEADILGVKISSERIQETAQFIKVRVKSLGCNNW